MTPATKPNVRESLASLHEMLRTGQSARAEPIARELQLAYPHRGDVNHIMGLVLSSLGRPEHAEPYHARAVAADSRNTQYLLNYGLCLLTMGRVAEAAKYYERAALIEPGNPVVTWRIGSFHVGVGQGDRALPYFRKALVAAPAGAKPAIHLELVECLLSLGRGEEAEAEIQSHLAQTPFRDRYIALLSGIGRHKADSVVARMVEEALHHPKLSPERRSNLLVRKGVMLENSGQFDEAFETFLAAKRLLKPPPPSQGFETAVSERIAIFTRERIARLADLYGDPSRRHIFVVGLPRSGTTLAAQIISAHSEVGNAGELETMTLIAAQLRGDQPLRQIEEQLAVHGTAKVRSLAEIYNDALQYLVPQRERAVDKMPDNFRYCAEISFLFPNARIVHCRRHPGDTFISAFQSEMNEVHSYSYDPISYAARYASYSALMCHWKAALPEGQIMDLDYEQLTADPRRVIGELLGFLGLDFEEACLNPERNMGTVTTFSRLQVRAAINTSSVGRWSNYERHLKPILDAHTSVHGCHDTKLSTPTQKN